MHWLINIPVWGERYRRNFLQRGLPSIVAALRYANVSPRDVLFVLHTDEPQEMRAAMEGCVVLTIPLGNNTPERLGNATRIGLTKAEPGECVMFYNADMVISRETFAACEKRFSEGKSFVTAHSVRVRDDADPALDASARELLAWGWDHRHRWVDDCIYGSGHAAGPAIVVFESPHNVVAHCFSLQCLAVHKTRDIVFSGPTCDELVDCFTPDEVHVVTDADELAIVEPCSPDMPYDRLPPPRFSWQKWRAINDRQITAFAPTYASEMMRWQFGRQIVIKGSKRRYAQAIADRILARADRSKHPARLLPFSDQRNAAVAFHSRKARFIRAVLRVPPSLRHLVPQIVRNEVIRWI